MNDVIIIGGGPAGMSAAIYAGRAGLDAVVIEKLFCGGRAATTYEVDNYPGIPKIGGPELSAQMEEHARGFGAKIVYGEISAPELGGPVKKVSVGNDVYTAPAVILAMGATLRKLGLESEERLRGSGVSYCATCDGMFFRDKAVAVVGGGNVAVEDALYLSKMCSKVYLIHRRDKLRAEHILQEALYKNNKITPLWNSVVEGIQGKFAVEGVAVKNVHSGKTETVPVSGVFVAVGNVPNSGLVNGIVDLDEGGYIKTDAMMQTSVPGVFAAGDICQKPLRQIVTAAADGAVAATSAAQYIALNKTNF